MRQGGQEVRRTGGKEDRSQEARTIGGKDNRRQGGQDARKDKPPPPIQSAVHSEIWAELGHSAGHLQLQAISGVKRAVCSVLNAVFSAKCAVCSVQ